MSDELPQGWSTTTVGDVVSKLVDGSHNPPPRVTHGLPMLSAKNVRHDGLSFDDARFIGSADFEREARRTRIATGDVLLTIVGSIGRSAVVSERNPSFTLQRSVAVMSTTAVTAEFLSYQFRAPSAQRFLELNARGTAQKGVYLNTLREMPVVVAPRPEQTRIVSKIDELFSRIAEGERALEHVSKLVERYRQSVLKAAVTGELTRGWREARKAAGEPVETGEALLARILTARRQAWEQAERARMKAKGIKPANDNWKKKYEEPASPDATELPDLPKGWVWASLDAVADVVGGITVDKKRQTADCDSVPYLRVANVQRGHLDLSEIKSILVGKDRIEQLRLMRGDILFNEGGDIDKLGRGWIWEGQLPLCIHQNHVFRARLFIPGALNKIISWYANVLGRKLFMSLGKQTTNLASLSLSKLKTFPVPVMSASEAGEVVDLVDDVLSVLEKQRNELAGQTAASASMRQSILKAAFSGELVPQDPADEPAIALLERIATERVASTTAATKRGRKKKTA